MPEILFDNAKHDDASEIATLYNSQIDASEFFVGT